MAEAANFKNSLLVMSFSENVIEVRGLGKRLRDATGELVILQDIDFAVAKGQSVAIVGASGSGKSTLLGLMAGLDTATDGNITLLGQSLGDLDEEGRAALRRGAVGFVFQSFQLMPHLTALENVMLPLELLGETREVRNRAVKLLEQVGLGSRMTHYPKQLSGGEQQRVALARAFVTEPAVLFADEPTGSLDTATGERVIDLMFSLNEASGATLVLVTHDLAIAQRCDATVQLAGGRVVNGAAV
ncbi:ABC transporter ATP-binding protein [Pandoraea anhela]|uniref:ABC transporter ATP-binding protein n=2 Tax=Pandoraea anhela TaxID=2508295 RepID=A0A5E4RNK7_9BURK|nr:ABC transporter ATP-binding protein [Pandoraea anhela]